MSDQTVFKTSLDGVYRILRPTFADDRGFFRESLRLKELEEHIGKPFAIVQGNHARSTHDILRGIHVAPWNKLIYITSGKVQAVIVDLKKDSPTFGKHESFIIGDDNRASIFIPAGCGNSYLVMSEIADYTYLTDQEWAPGKEFGVAYNDPTLSITWETNNAPILSEKDQHNPSFEEVAKQITQ